MTHFCTITLTGIDSSKFLQGQLTINVNKLDNHFRACAIANLKGRVEFGLWATCDDNGYHLVCVADCMATLTAHLKKYGAFSKIHLSDSSPIYPAIIENTPTFVYEEQHKAAVDFQTWAQLSIQLGNYWIAKATQGLFQPQELRLHQQGGVDYDKGCYLGQEVIARVYFKSEPKAYLHRVLLTRFADAGDKVDKAYIVNTTHTSKGVEALVICPPEALAAIGTTLKLPPSLTEKIGRQK